MTDLRALGLGRGADASAVREAFKHLVLELHPDRATSDGERATRTEKLARVVAAYQRLTG